MCLHAAQVWVVVLSNLIAILLQTLSARLGICTGKHLAQVGWPWGGCCGACGGGGGGDIRCAGVWSVLLGSTARRTAAAVVAAVAAANSGGDKPSIHPFTP